MQRGAVCPILHSQKHVFQVNASHLHMILEDVNIPLPQCSTKLCHQAPKPELKGYRSFTLVSCQIANLHTHLHSLCQLCKLFLQYFLPKLPVIAAYWIAGHQSFKAIYCELTNVSCSYSLPTFSGHSHLPQVNIGEAHKCWTAGNDTQDALQKA